MPMAMKTIADAIHRTDFFIANLLSIHPAAKGYVPFDHRKI